MGETNLPAQEPSPSAQPRLPSPDVDPSGASHHQGSTPQGPPAAVRLIERIGDRATFVYLRRTGRRVRRGAITVTFARDAPVDHPETNHPRAAYAIGRGVGNAVQRNRLRRRLRTIMSEQGPQLASGAYLVGAGPKAAELSFGELRTTVSKALEEAVEEAER